VGDCFVDNGTLHATAVVRNNGSTATHSYQATVVWGPTDNPFASKVVAFTDVRPGQTDHADATAPATPRAPTSGTVRCAITKLVDESGKQPAMGPALTPPPNTQPSATPSETPTESPSAPETPSLPTVPFPVPS
jgi:hypothetical protein